MGKTGFGDTIKLDFRGLCHCGEQLMGNCLVVLRNVRVASPLTHLQETEAYLYQWVAS